MGGTRQGRLQLESNQEESQLPRALRPCLWQGARPMKLLVIVLLSLCALFAGCASPCRQLTEKQCDCLVSQFDRNACRQRAATNENVYPATAEDSARCEQLLPQCDCRLIDTPEGKKRCGFARAPSPCDADLPDGGTLPDGGACPVAAP
jgi:hypothetical protein